MLQLRRSMASSWIEKRLTANGQQRYRVRYRLLGSEAPRYAGSFKTEEEADIRKAWVLREIAAMRVPDTKRFSNAEADQERNGISSFEERGAGMSLLQVVRELERE